MNLFKPVISLLSQNKVWPDHAQVVYPDLDPPEINAMHNDMSRQKWPTVFWFPRGLPGSRKPSNGVAGVNWGTLMVIRNRGPETLLVRSY